MADYKNIVMNYLNGQGIRYTDVDERVISIGYNADNIESVKIYIFFDKDGDGLVHLASGVIAKFAGDNAAKGIVVCNSMNNRFRWAKFELDKDQDIVAETDAIVTPDTVGPVCLQLVKRMVGIIDEAYPEIMKARFA